MQPPAPLSLFSRIAYTLRMKDEYNIVVCASGGGGNFQALIEAQEKYGFTITHLITDRECGAIERAHRHHIPVLFHPRKTLGPDFWNVFLSSIPEGTDLIVLAGFMPIVPEFICTAWAGRMINTHPSLLPKYGGKGMYGVRVQEAVIAAGEEFGGCSVHLVTPEIDGGDIIIQEAVKTIPGENAWDLGGRIFKVENRILPDAVRIMKERHHD